MKKVVWILLPILFIGCSKSYSIEDAENLLIKDEGVVAGVTLGDDWTSTKDRIIDDQKGLIFLMNEEMTVLTTDKDNLDDRIHMIFDVDSDNLIYGLSIYVAKPENQGLGDLQVKLIEQLEGKFENQSDELGAFMHSFEEGGYISVNGEDKEDKYKLSIYYMR